MHIMMSETLHSLSPEMEQFVKTMERNIGIKRESIAYGLAAIVALYLTFGSEAGFVCNVICFTYPAFQSLRLVDERSTNNALKWILYWVIFGVLALLDRFADEIKKLLPVYWLVKCTFCIYLFLPQTDGVNRFRDNVLAPFFKLLHRKPREIASLFELQVKSKKHCNVAESKTEQLALPEVARNLDVIREAHLPIFFIIGGPGAGKGTQCNKIVEKYGLTHLSTGDLLRVEMESSKPGAAELKHKIQNGELVPSNVVFDLLKEAMIRAVINGSRGFLIDGYPREITQADQFESDIQPPDLVLYFEVSEKTLIERCLNRAKTSGRIDDNLETIRKRLKTYEASSAPLVEYYAKKRQLVRIPSEGNPNGIFAIVETHLDRIMSKQWKVQ